MNSHDVRRTFLEFFAAKEHQIVPSSPLILPSDPSLLFANAGMNQFKEVFRGREKRPYSRATSAQKCLRVSGKHNDLEEVGRTPRHHTFFEMLGNFSFGEYFKQEAIAWAWELCLDVLKLPAERLHVTVFEGDEQFPADEEAERLWQTIAGLPASRVTALGRKDNFWQMGDTGPAGPCSEILIDLDPRGAAGDDPRSHPDRYLELWNLVFMQYDLQADGSAAPLPAPSVDTGAGLERICAVLQGVESNYDTDSFQGIIRPLARQAGMTYGDDDSKDVSLRVIADHLRAITMLIAEGVIPGPAKRGAVLRRILRRALRHGRRLDLRAPFLHEHVGRVVDLLGEPYPELREALPIVERVTRKEEERFERTLADGFERLEERIDALTAAGVDRLPGDEAFVLESERGLPLDLIRDALSERGLVLDEADYETARRRHVDTSRVLREDRQDAGASTLYLPLQGRGSRFVGYSGPRVEAARVVGLLGEGGHVDRLAAGVKGEVILDETPFYAESGGQLGDHGLLLGGEARVKVLDTRSPVPGVIAHSVEVEQGELAIGQLVVAQVDADQRLGAKRHHTATHLLHAALRQILGTHVRQAGSLVAPDRLRFDFSHYEGVDPVARRDIEDLANDVVLADESVETEIMPLDEALATGAMAFFGDRYGETVRVVRIGDFSLELCGGTHVSRTGEIGPVLVTGERGVAAGVRRVEALAGRGALLHAREQRETLSRIAGSIGVARGELVEGLEKKLDSLKRLQRQNEELQLRLARESGGDGAEVTEVCGLSVTARMVSGLNRSQRRDLADGLRQKDPSSVVVIGANDEGKASLLIAVGVNAREKIDARALIRRLSSIVGGGGGGRADLAEAGGKNPERLEEALAEAPDGVRELVENG